MQDGHISGPDGVSLGDHTIPVDPESVARALGEAIRRHHAGTETGQVNAMASMASTLEKQASAQPDAVMATGPYLGRPVLELARLAAETVSVLPPAIRPSVPIRAGLTLADCVLSRDGRIVIDGLRADGDREIELAAAAVALGGRHGPAVVAPLLDAYGMDQFDLRRLDTAQLLVSVAAQLGVDLGAVAGCG